jgi:hypothetical protein
MYSQKRWLPPGAVIHVSGLLESSLKTEEICYSKTLVSTHQTITRPHKPLFWLTGEFPEGRVNMLLQDAGIHLPNYNTTP